MVRSSGAGRSGAGGGTEADQPRDKSMGTGVRPVVHEPNTSSEAGLYFFSRFIMCKQGQKNTHLTGLMCGEHQFLHVEQPRKKVEKNI